jgi:hypothetical protein
MLVKAQVHVESDFNVTAISGDVPCSSSGGLGHSYGLLQWTPMCQSSPIPGEVSATANSEVVCPTGCGYGQPTEIVCLPGGCTAGDWLLTEKCIGCSSNVTISALTSNSYSQSEFDVSVFNSTYNLKIGESFDSGQVGNAKNDISGCTYAQYQLLGMELYNYGSPKNYQTGQLWLTSCTSDNPNSYGAAVKSAYSSLVSTNSIWCDVYSSSCSNNYGTDVSGGSEPSSINDYFYDNNWNLGNWNNQYISNTGDYGILNSEYQPWCPSSVTVTISGSTTTDPYSRALWVNFSDGGSVDKLASDVVVYQSFSYSYNIPASYLTNHGIAHMPFILTTQVIGDYWNVKETIQYSSASTC